MLLKLGGYSWLLARGKGPGGEQSRAGRGGHWARWAERASFGGAGQVTRATQRGVLGGVTVQIAKGNRTNSAPLYHTQPHGSAKKMQSQYLSRRELNPGLERSLDSCRQVSDDKLTY